MRKLSMVVRERERVGKRERVEDLMKAHSRDEETGTLYYGLRVRVPNHL